MYQRPSFIKYRYLSGQALLTKASEFTFNLYELFRSSFATINCITGVDPLENDFLLSESLFENIKRGRRSVDILTLVKIIAAEERGTPIPVMPGYSLSELKKLEVPISKLEVIKQHFGRSANDGFSLYSDKKGKHYVIANNAVYLSGLVQAAVLITGACLSAEAIDDVYETAPCVLVNVDLAANDVVSKCSATIYTVLTPPTKGNLVLNNDGTGTYTPNPGVANTTDTATIQLNCDGSTITSTITFAITEYTFLLVDDYYAAFATETLVEDISLGEDAECCESTTMTYVLNTVPLYSSSYSLDANTGILTYTPDVNTEGNQEILEIESYCNGQASGITQTIIIDIFEPPSSLPFISCLNGYTNSLEISGTAANFIRVTTTGGYDSGIIPYTSWSSQTITPALTEGDTATLTACYDSSCFYSLSTDCSVPVVTPVEPQIEVTSLNDLSNVNLNYDISWTGGSTRDIYFDFYDSNSNLLYQYVEQGFTPGVLSLSLDLSFSSDISTLEIWLRPPCSAQDGCTGWKEIIDFCSVAQGLDYEDLNCLVLDSGLNNGDGTITYAFINNCQQCSSEEVATLYFVSGDENNHNVTYDAPNPYYNLQVLDTDGTTILQETGWTEFDPCNVISPPSARFTGDTALLGADGEGNPWSYVGGASGNFLNTFQLRDKLGNSLGPDTGFKFDIAFKLADGQLISSAKYDYSSVINLATDTPISTVSGNFTLPNTYSDTVIGPYSITWTDIQAHMVAGVNLINSSGAGTISFNKKDFADAFSLTDADAAIYEVFITVTNAEATSAQSKSCMCIQSNTGNIDNAFNFTPISDTKAVMLGNATTLHGYDLIQNARCGDFPVVKTIGTVSDGSLSSSSSSNDFEVNNERIFVIGGSTSTAYDIRYYYRNSVPEAFSWAALYDFETMVENVATENVVIDSINLINGKPQVYFYISQTASSTPGIIANPSPFTNDLYHCYWDGTNWVSTFLLDVTLSTDDDKGWRDPSTGHMYHVGTNDFYIINYSGQDFTVVETSNPSNYSITSLLSTTASQGSLSSTVTGKSIQIAYAGDYNSEPSFITFYSTTNAINWIFYNGTSWENKVIATFPASATLTSGTFNESTVSWDIQTPGGINQAYLNEVTDVTQALQWHIFDPNFDRIFLMTFTSGNLTTPTYTCEIEEFINNGTSSTPIASQIF